MWTMNECYNDPPACQSPPQDIGTSPKSVPSFPLTSKAATREAAAGSCQLAGGNGKRQLSHQQLETRVSTSLLDKLIPWMNGKAQSARCRISNELQRTLKAYSHVETVAFTFISFLTSHSGTLQTSKLPQCLTNC